MPWASPYELWLLSTIETDRSASVIIHPNLNEIQWMQSSKDAFATTWGQFAYRDLNKRYFKFKDSTNVYEQIK